MLNGKLYPDIVRIYKNWAVIRVTKLNVTLNNLNELKH